MAISEQNYKIGLNIKLFILGNITFKDPIEIGNKFNDIFADTDKNLASKISKSKISYKDYLNKIPSVNDSMFLNPVNGNEIETIVSSLKNKTISALITSQYQYSRNLLYCNQSFISYHQSISFL